METNPAPTRGSSLAAHHAARATAAAIRGVDAPAVVTGRPELVADPQPAATALAPSLFRLPELAATTAVMSAAPLYNKARLAATKLCTPLGWLPGQRLHGRVHRAASLLWLTAESDLGRDHNLVTKRGEGLPEQ